MSFTHTCRLCALRSKALSAREMILVVLCSFPVCRSSQCGNSQGHSLATCGSWVGAGYMAHTYSAQKSYQQYCMTSIGICKPNGNGNQKGGGSVQITAGSMVLDGKITAQGRYTSSGGSVNIQIADHWGRSVSGTGSIDVGVQNSGSGSDYAGGGRVAIVGYTTISQAIIDNVRLDGALTTKGGSGTLYLESIYQKAFGQLVIRSTYSAAFDTPIAGRQTLCSITVNNANVPDNKDLRVCGACTKLGSGTITCPSVNATNCQCDEGCKKPSLWISDAKCAVTCPVGTFTHNVTKVCTPCNGIDEYSDTTHSPGCKARGTCDAGQFANNPVSANSKVSCSSCPGGSFMPSQNRAATCRAHGTCQLGTRIIARGGTSTTDTVCEVCPPNTYTDQVNQNTCTPVSSCVRIGQYVSTRATATSNLICKACPSGKFQAAIGHRLAHCTVARTACLRAEFITAPSTLSSDLVCKPHTRCIASQYEGKAPTTTSDRVCQDITFCAPGTFQTRHATGFANAVCLPCPAGEYQDRTGALTCTPVSMCQPGQFIRAAETSSSDKDCAPCAVGGYQPLANQGVCVSAKTCEKGSFVSINATSTADRQCEPCSEGLTYQDLPNQQQCKPVTPCTKQTSANATLFSDANCCPNLKYGTKCVDACPSETYETPDDMVCRPCRDCQNEEYTFRPCSDVGNRLCKALQQCVAGEYVSKASTLTSQRECSSCPAKTFSSEGNTPVCASWLGCMPGTYISTQATPLSDRVCSPCTLGLTYQLESNQNHCVAVSTCKQSETQLAAPTTSTDRVCRPTHESPGESTAGYTLGENITFTSTPIGQTVLDVLAKVAAAITSNTNSSSSSATATAAEINSIPGVGGALDGVDYTQGFTDGSYADPATPTAREIQAAIDAVNTQRSNASGNEDGNDNDSTQMMIIITLAVTLGLFVVCCLVCVAVNRRKASEQNLMADLQVEKNEERRATAERCATVERRATVEHEAKTEGRVLHLNRSSEATADHSTASTKQKWCRLCCRH